MAANKPIIFNINVDTPTPQQQKDPIHPESNPHLENKKQRQKGKQQARNSNLGVELTMKKITKSPIPDILPALLPNQPVQALGQTNIPPITIANNTIQQPIPFNPAVIHPAAGNQPLEFPKNAPFKPETTHPAVLAYHQIIQNVQTNKSKKPTQKTKKTKSNTKKNTRKPTQKTFNKTKNKITTHKIYSL